MTKATYSILALCILSAFFTAWAQDTNGAKPSAPKTNGLGGVQPPPAPNPDTVIAHLKEDVKKLAKYERGLDRLCEGMSYERVCKVMDGEGRRTGSIGARGGKEARTFYEWALVDHDTVLKTTFLGDALEKWQVQQIQRDVPDSLDSLEVSAFLDGLQYKVVAARWSTSSDQIYIPGKGGPYLIVSVEVQNPGEMPKSASPSFAVMDERGAVYVGSLDFPIETLLNPGERLQGVAMFPVPRTHRYCLLALSGSNIGMLRIPFRTPFRKPMRQGAVYVPPNTQQVIVAPRAGGLIGPGLFP